MLPAVLAITHTLTTYYIFRTTYAIVISFWLARILVLKAYDKIGEMHIKHIFQRLVNSIHCITVPK